MNNIKKAKLAMKCKNKKEAEINLIIQMNKKDENYLIMIAIIILSKIKRLNKKANRILLYIKNQTKIII